MITSAIFILFLLGAAIAVAFLRRPKRRRSASAREWRQAHELFTEALELPPDKRRELIAGRTRTDPALEREVERLLDAHESTGPLDRLHSLLFTGERSAHRGSAPSPLQHAAITSRDEPAEVPTGARVAGHYELLGQLGAGGMGVVHRARDTRLGREVALKFLPAQNDASEVARERFVREARAAAALDHPNICTVHEIGENDDGSMFIAMALYDGETLADRIARGPINWEEAVDIVAQVARGLAVAHGAGVVHRDIKPANLCITSDEVVKIVDFGIAMVAGNTLADAGPFLGTLAYLSPEQARGEVVDSRTDLWSLGVVMYEMLTGERLFQGDHWAALLSAIRGDDPLPLGALRGVAPLPVIRVLQRLLARDPAERLQRAESIVQELAEATAAVRERDESAGEPIRGLAPGGERRQVTVVSSELRALRPEDALSQIADAAAEVIASYGGAINSVVEGRLVAVFGVPVTYEDDLLRAARAVFDLHELIALGTVGGNANEPSIASAIARGMADVRESAERAGSYELSGDVSRRAAQLAAAAEPGTVLLAGQESIALGAHFEMVHHDPVPGELEGGPIDAVQLLPRSTGATEMELARDASLTAFVGRARELDVLSAALEAAIDGEGSVAVVVGDAGSGKSRLLHELRRRCRARPVRIATGRCQSYTGSKPYHAFVDAVRDVLGLDGENRFTARADLVEEAIDQLDPMLGAFKPFYLQLLGVASDGASRQSPSRGESARRAMTDALTALFTVAAESQPLVLLLEDWHWGDDASAEALRQLAEVGSSYPMLMIVTFRPGYGVDSDALRPVTSIQLSSLQVIDTAAMTGALLGVDDVPSDVASALHERSGGNPFYLEELCRSLQEAGMLRVVDGRATLSGDREHRHLPVTIQGVIRSRLDRLSPDAREVVRAAAVLGRDFTLRLLEQMGLERYALSQTLPALTALGIVQRVSVLPDHSFRFSHVLIHDVAYDTLLAHQRVALHRRAARATASVHAARLEEHAARLAWHFSNCGEWLEAARYGQLAARRSRALDEYGDALRTLEVAEEWLSRAPEGKPRDELLVGLMLEEEEICETLGLQDHQGEIIDRLLTLPQVRADPVRLADVYRRQGDRLTLLREFDKARRVLESALALVTERRDRAAEGMLLRSLGLLGWHSGQLDTALEFLDRALDVERAREDPRTIAISLSSRAQVLKGLGRPQEAMASLEAALAALEGTPPGLLSSSIHYMLGTLYRSLGDLDRAADSLRRSEDVFAAERHPIYESFSAAASAHVFLARGQFDCALEAAERSVERARRSGYADGLARSLHSLGELLTRMGRGGEALDHFEEAGALFRRLGRAVMERRTLLRTALVAERSQAFARALRAWERCAELEGGRGDLAGELRARIGMARTGRRAQPSHALHWQEELERALAMARECGAPAAEAESHNSLGVLRWENGDFDSALQHFDSALGLFRRLGDDRHAAVMLNSLGATLRSMGRPAEARDRLLEGVALGRESSSRQVEGHAEAILGDLAFDAGDMDGARERYDRSLAIRIAIGDRRGEGWMQLSLSRVDGAMGRVKEARAKLDIAGEIAADVGDSVLGAAVDEVGQPEPETVKED